MGRKQRAQELVIVPLEALTGAMKSGVVPVPQPRLPEAIVGIEVGRGTGIETEIVTGIVTETGSVTGTGTETGNGIVTGIETEIETETEIEIETEKALSEVSASEEGVVLGIGLDFACAKPLPQTVPSST